MNSDISCIREGTHEAAKVEVSSIGWGAPHQYFQLPRYDTNYFTPPYAKVRLQLRTKYLFSRLLPGVWFHGKLSVYLPRFPRSQYPYMLNTDVTQHTLSVASETSVRSSWDFYAAATTLLPKANVDDTTGTPVTLELSHLADDSNCTVRVLFLK